MHLQMIGLNHRTASVALRERVAVQGDVLHQLLKTLSHESPAAECVILSTCNRTEIYIARSTHEQPDADTMRHHLAASGHISADELTRVTLHRDQDRAALHLFRVCSGLDSMVLGEPQILGQVKRAYETAIECETVGPTLHKLFQEAIKAGKRARTDTGIGEGRLSIGSIAVDFARQVFDRFDDKTIVALGAGEIAEVTLRHFQSLKPNSLCLINRTHERAILLAEQLGLSEPHSGARPWEDLDEMLVSADVLIASTAATEAILTAARFKPLIRRRRRRPLLILDLALPRDVEPEVGTLANIYLYNIDDLQSVAVDNSDTRREQVEACEHQLAEAVGRCMMAVQHRDLGQLIRQLRVRLHTIGERELERTMSKITAMTESDQHDALHQVVEEHTQRVINKILHLPLSQFNQRDTEAPLGFYAAALRRLFDLEEQLDVDESLVSEKTS